MALKFLTAGESHGPGLVAILEGLPAGLPLSPEVINAELARRQQGYGAGARMKIEHDQVHLLGGVLEGFSTGAPLAFCIENRDHAKWQGKAVPAFTTPRPGHADLTGVLKYGYRDLRPALERASARETAARVAVGAVCKHFLTQFAIQVVGYVTQIGDVRANIDDIPIAQRFKLAESSTVRCPDLQAAQLMLESIRQVMADHDTLGGVIEILALGLPVGLGSHVHWERRLEARLGAALLSVQAVKGIEIGPAFENASLTGTQVHDPIRLQGDQLVRPANRAGGLEGGITNGQPLLVRAAMKPIATTLEPLPTVDLVSGQETNTQYERSDFCPVPRAVPVLESMLAFILADALVEKLGGDSLQEMLPRFESLPQARLSDISLDGKPHTFWLDKID
jgi:chorismate synthase